MPKYRKLFFYQVYQVKKPFLQGLKVFLGNEGEFKANDNVGSYTQIKETNESKEDSKSLLGGHPHLLWDQNSSVWRGLSLPVAGKYPWMIYNFWVIYISFMM